MLLSNRPAEVVDILTDIAEAPVCHRPTVQRFGSALRWAGPTQHCDDQSPATKAVHVPSSSMTTR